MRTTILGIVLALLIAGSAVYVLNDTSAQTASVGSAITSSSSASLFNLTRLVELLKQLVTLRTQLVRVSPVAIPYATTTPIVHATSTPTTPISASKPSSTVTASPITTQAKPAATPNTSTPQQSPTERALGLVLPTLRSSLVNIVCVPNSAGTNLKGISGSGIIIDPHGIILTVAHVAQYELLAEARPDLVTCFVRKGSPAALTYKAKPIYISSTWIAQNSETISSSDPRGTGENDYALLAITSSDTKASVPSSFTYVPISSSFSRIGDSIVIGSYGAEFLTSTRIRDDLFPTLVFGTVKDLFTFHTDTLDIISLGGGAAAQQGSSGGGIANQTGQLVGLITTSSSASDLASRDLHAMTMTYLQRAFKAESGTDLNSYITSTNNTNLVNAYAGKATTLANTLISANNLGK